MKRYLVIFDERQDDEVISFNKLDEALDYIRRFFMDHFHVDYIQFVLAIDEFGETYVEYNNEDLVEMHTVDYEQDERERYYASVL